MIPPKKRRSTRLRKKLHIDEFKELGFKFETELISTCTNEEQENLIERFFYEVIEPRSLQFGGWITGGFVAADKRKSATEADRESVKTWLTACSEISSVEVSPLIDAWHIA